MAASAKSIAKRPQHTLHSHSFANEPGCTTNASDAFVGYSNGASPNYAGADYSGVLTGAANEACSQNSAIVAGVSNIISSIDPVGTSGIGSGSNNVITSYESFIGAGQHNEANLMAFVGAGYVNSASASGSVVGGGDSEYYNISKPTSYGNVASGVDSFVGSGDANEASGAGSFVGGGDYIEAANADGNAAFGIDSFIGAGDENENRSNDAFIGGGSLNSIAGASAYAAIAGGSNNLISAPESFIGAGYGNEVSYPAGFVGAGIANHSSAANAFVGAGYGNYAEGQGAAIAAGGSSSLVAGGNSVAGQDAFLGAGDLNSIRSNEAFVGAGMSNAISSTAPYGVIEGGSTNSVSSLAGAIAGGASNVVSGEYGTVAGGTGNVASGIAGTVAGGYKNTASGQYSFAAGYGSNANKNGSFVWSDDSPSSGQLAPTAANEFIARATGGVVFLTNAAETTGVKLAPGSGAWASASDRNLKSDVSNIDDLDVLARVAALPIAQWTYTSERGVRHVGPMAQDFYAAFGVGEDDRHIASIDEEGVAIAAIKALHDENDLLRRRLTDDQFRNALEEARIARDVALLQTQARAHPAVRRRQSRKRVPHGSPNCTANSPQSFIGYTPPTTFNNTENIAGGTYSGILTGTLNYACDDEDIVIGGLGAQIGVDDDDASIQSFVASGFDNMITGPLAAIGGGGVNIASSGAFIGAGESNAASGAGSAIGGGDTEYDKNSATTTFPGNVALGTDAFIGAGDLNVASGSGSFIGGGGFAAASATPSPGPYQSPMPTSENQASGVDSFIGAGDQNQAGTQQSFVGGGQSNFMYGDDAAIVGGEANQVVAAYDGFIGAGLQNIEDSSSGFVGSGQMNVVNQNATYAFIGAGFENQVSGPSAIVGGGTLNVAPYNDIAGGDSFIGAGDANQIVPNEAFIGAGQGNSISQLATYASIGGGYKNSAGGVAATIGGGSGNAASGELSAVSGGDANSASGAAGTVVGGYENHASGQLSFAAGYGSSASKNGSFVWSDDSPTSGHLSPTVANEFIARATGGIVFLSNAGETTGVMLAPGSGAWASASDRNLKNDVTKIDDADVLAKVAALPVASWSYISEQGVRHVGPMAQDFHAAFKVGEDDRHITSIDEAGVSLAAIKALHDENEALRELLNREEARFALDETTNNKKLATIALSTGSASSVKGAAKPRARRGQPRLRRPHASPPTGCSGNSTQSFVGYSDAGAPNSSAGAYSGIISGIYNEACDNGDGIGGGVSNIIGNNGYASDSFIGSGADNSITGRSSFIGGGELNYAGSASMVGGGYLNEASGFGSAIFGGGSESFAQTNNFAASNVASGEDAFVGAGDLNVASGSGSFVGGGGFLWASSGATTTGNQAGGNDSFVGAGDQNVALASESFIGGGQQNNIAAAGTYAAVVGGERNSLSGQEAFIGAGESNKANSQAAFVGAGVSNLAGAAETFVGAGYGNAAEGQGSAIVAGGLSSGTVPGNVITGQDAFIGAGDLNTIAANEAFVGAGQSNAIASGATYAVIGGGYTNTVSGVSGAIGGGAENKVTGEYGMITGGAANVASGVAATVAGGYENTASGQYSFAAGLESNANKNGCFVWADESTNAGKLTPNVANQFIVRATGGVVFLSNAAETTGVSLAPGSGAWASASDRNLKRDVTRIDDADVLAKVAALPITAWSYISEQGVRHVGPMAQDFYAAFKVGEDDRHITSIDEDGIALAAIKALNDETNELSKRLARDEARHARAEARYASELAAVKRDI